MEVICKGHNTCEDKLDCKHSKPHKLKLNCEITEHNSKNCYCNHAFLRKQKLLKINQTR